MCTASGRWPCSHSSGSRMSIQSAPSSACAPAASSSEISALVLLSRSRYVLISDVNGSGRYLHSRMSAQARMRAIVAVTAVVAAAVVAGVVYATRQDPAQPKAGCKDGVPAAFYMPSKSTTAVRDALKKGSKQAARALEALAAERPKDPVVQFNYATALYCAGFGADATA